MSRREFTKLAVAASACTVLVRVAWAEDSPQKNNKKPNILFIMTDQQPLKVRDLYGDTVFGRQCLGARRLIEHGVWYVEVMHPGYWDTHGGAENGQRKLSQVLDRPMAALIADLNYRGMLDDTLVVWMGEFGRDSSGNDHSLRRGRRCSPAAG